MTQAGEKLSSRSATDLPKVGSRHSGRATFLELPTISPDSSQWSGQRYLPIEWLKDSAFCESMPIVPRRTFLSSGTTSADRSKSAFSVEGIASYREAALSGFAAMLSRALPPSADGSDLTPRGIILIPDVATWPDSSLAQMGEWLTEVYPCRYATAETLTHACQDFFLSNDNSPVFVFGTAFDFVNLADDGVGPLALPRHSIVIETGGTKGRSRSVTRQELYDLIDKMFSVPQDRIVSEYGMAELASQAYDVVDFGHSRELTQRRFRFFTPHALAVTQGCGLMEAAGVGSLVISDRARIDLSVPIRTQDIAELEESGQFRLLGRASAAPLKGCSLMSERPSPHSHAAYDSGKSRGTASSMEDKLPTPETTAHLLRTLIEISQDTDILASLAFELGSMAAARWALDDFRRALPTSHLQWCAKLKTAFDGQPLVIQWLVIPAGNHPFSSIEALCYLALMPVRIRVRMPTAYSSENSSLALIVRHLAAAGLTGQITVDGTGRRIAAISDAAAFERILVYGDDETIAAFESFAPEKVIGHGAVTSMSVIHAHELESTETIQLVAKDWLSLGQRGCLSTKQLLVLESQQSTTQSMRQSLAKTITQAGASWWQAPLSLRDRLALDHIESHCQLTGLHTAMRATVDHPLVIVGPMDATSIAHVANAFVLSISFLPTASAARLIASTQGAVALSLSRGARDLFDTPHTRMHLGPHTDPCALGASNARPWTGAFLGRPVLARPASHS